MTDLHGAAGAEEPRPLTAPSPAASLVADERAASAPSESQMTLFNEDRFHALNLGEGQSVLRAEAREHDSGRVVGTLGGVLEGGALTSGYSAPFGGLDLARERETPANVALLVDEALRQFRGKGVRTLRVKLPPACYGESEPLVQFTLLNRGFTLERCELNQHIALDSLDDAEDYIQQLKSPARRALGKLLGAEFTFGRAETDEQWDRAYTMLEANRAAKGRALSLSREYVFSARAALGESVRMYELAHLGRAIAAALVYRVRAKRDFVVAWGDFEHGLERSPMNLLAYRLIESSLEQGAMTLDLGTSNDCGPDGAVEPNTGLVQFKQSVLAKIEPRFTLVREL
jgi:hypothetical protein